MENGKWKFQSWKKKNMKNISNIEKILGIWKKRKKKVKRKNIKENGIWNLENEYLDTGNQKW